MGNKFFAFYIIVLLGSLVLFRCNNTQVENTEYEEKEIGRTLHELQDEKDLFKNEWERFRSDAEFNIKVNEKRIEDMNEDIQSASYIFKNKYENKINLITEKNLELKYMLAGYKYKGRDSWSEFKKIINKDFDLLENSLNQIFTNND